ncbi:MAG: hypothetical protein K2X80_01820 [Pseudomonadaceae bacterium]|nr:hypothetical protein [Pseudomonadaceae bacterium]
MSGQEMKIHYVAFLDILGFKSIVENEAKHGTGEYLGKLFKCHQKCTEIFKSDPQLTIIQFSDSIVISRPYEASEFRRFVTSIATYQRYLLDENLLCRGGVAVNKHFTSGTFTFSSGLIDAYNLESTTARFPRVVISPDVIDLIFSGEKLPVELIEEDDGVFFIDYIGITKNERPIILARAVEDIIESLLVGDSSSVREKGIWLANYSDALLGTSFTPRKFKGGLVSI